MKLGEAGEAFAISVPMTKWSPFFLNRLVVYWFHIWLIKKSMIGSSFSVVMIYQSFLLIYNILSQLNNFGEDPFSKHSQQPKRKTREACPNQYSKVYFLNTYA